MFPFDRALAVDDDLIVLAAYAAAEEEAMNARKPLANGPAASPVEPGAAPIEEGIPGSTNELDSPALNAMPGLRRQIWVRRLRAIEGIPHERLAPIHGRLIAHGLLQFQLNGRSEGVVYRLTSEGRKSIALAGTEDSEAA